MEKKRESNIELLRIILMIFIIAHHFVVNSGVMEEFSLQNNPINTLYLAIFGFAGKIIINVFLIISGYFMIKSKFSSKKFLKLYLEIKFYKIIIYLFFLIFGITTFNKTEIKKGLFSVVYGTNVYFMETFLLLYLLIPIINKSIINKKNIQYLLIILLFYYSILGTVFDSSIYKIYNEITWYIIIYIVGAYIRLYPKKYDNNKKMWFCTSLVNILLSVFSVIFILIINNRFNKNINIYYFVNNSNKILAVTTAISIFMLFKNINIKYNKTINTIASATFGVLLIHANSDEMRYFLWNKIFNVKNLFYNKFLVLYSIGIILLVYTICTIIELLRIKFIEKPFFKKIYKGKVEELFERIDNFVN